MSEYHLCGLLLLSRPEQIPAITRTLETLSGVELHLHEGGRMVVTVEGESYHACAERMTELAILDGVSALSLVYHQVDTEPSLPKEFQP